MAFYEKEDMIYTDYKWTAYPNDNPKIVGKPDSTLLNRNEGYEVLYLINAFAEKHGFKKTVSGNVVEEMIRKELPIDIRSQEGIFMWVEENW